MSLKICFLLCVCAVSMWVHMCVSVYVRVCIYVYVSISVSLCVCACVSVCVPVSLCCAHYFSCVGVCVYDVAPRVVAMARSLIRCTTPRSTW